MGIPSSKVESSNFCRLPELGFIESYTKPSDRGNWTLTNPDVIPHPTVILILEPIVGLRLPTDSWYRFHSFADCSERSSGQFRGVHDQHIECLCNCWLSRLRSSLWISSFPNPSQCWFDTSTLCQGSNPGPLRAKQFLCFSTTAADKYNE